MHGGKWKDVVEDMNDEWGGKHYTAESTGPSTKDWLINKVYYR